jgi:hypothetical protein
VDGEGCVRVRTRRSRVTECRELRVSRDRDSFATEGKDKGSGTVFPNKDWMEDVEE